MGGIQMQYAPAGYIGLWSRMADFERSMLTRALEERRVIQGTLMRATIHTVSAADYWPMEVGVRAGRREWWLRAAGSRIQLDPDALSAPSSKSWLRVHCGRRSSAAGSGSAATRPQSSVSMLADIVRVPPSGTGTSAAPTSTALAADWLKRPKLAERDGIELLIRRYLGGFGPALLGDVANWMGVNISAINEVAATMKLRSFRDGETVALVDLPDGPCLTRRRRRPRAARLGRHPARPCAPHPDPAGGVSAARLQHEDAAFGEHRPARRAGGRDMALRQGRTVSLTPSGYRPAPSAQRSPTRCLGSRTSTRTDRDP